MKKYTDDELRKMYEEAVKRDDMTLATAIMAVAMARGSGSEDELHNLHMMFTGYLVTKQEAVTKGPHNKGENHEIRDVDLTGLDPDMVVQF